MNTAPRQNMKLYHLLAQEVARDTRFSVAVHGLMLISQASAADSPITSARIATSTEVNASYVRKVMAGLVQSGIVTSRSGSQGYEMAMAPRDATLLAIHDAACGEPLRVMDLHRNPNDDCIVGRHITPVLSEVMAHAEDALRCALASQSLHDCIGSMRARLHPDEIAQLKPGGNE
ncbi:Rrf2 family transcriptional regulator [Actinobaculum sp. 352]|uniref:Rrf2 family transcriptional regulator n=1 Tax=Actinobaculum sp. 352 TaxID=2490946 RepID=UPI0013DEC097|nr:Rrf2 family transcriptional regulator [Actinobaculum sp. 352]